MDDLNALNRPLTASELAQALDLSVGRLARLMARHSIRPACTIGPLRVYGPAQVRAIIAALEAEQATA